MDKYQYHPIESPDQIRMLELLPGQDDEPIQVKISHRLLADLPLREALSYEWGSPTRDREIICEGKSLKVTANLVVALTRLGPATKELEHTERAKGPQTSRLLWVDALCINQDDIDERNEQVKLMGDIYRNARRTLAWIGEAPPDFAQETFELVEELASIVQRLEIDEFGTSGRIRAPQTVEIRPDYYLKHLLDDEIWTMQLRKVPRTQSLHYEAGVLWSWACGRQSPRKPLTCSSRERPDCQPWDGTRSDGL
ncbi:Heterokaryon incompatibility protein (HET) domain containing protein [Hyaloscypha variabilis]